MSSVHDTPKPSGPLDEINMTSPLPLRDWNDAFKLSTPVGPSPRHTPSKTNWKLGAPQRTPQAKTPVTVQFRPSRVRPASMSTRRVQQGAAAASTPAQAGQKFLPRSQISDLIAPSLASLPNALSAEYWLKKAQAQEEAGDLQAAISVFELANKRDVRPATSISRAYGEFLIRHKLQQPAVNTPAFKVPSAVKARATPASVRQQHRLQEDQENSQRHNLCSTPTQEPMTPETTKGKKSAARRQSKVHFQTPEANVVSEATDPLQDDRNNSSQAGSTPFQKARPPRRVSFAAPDVVAIPDKHITAGSSVRSHEQAGLSSTWQDRNTVGDVHADYKSRHYAASTDEGSTLGSQHTMHNPAAVSKPVTLSIELFAAPGSTPYLKGSQLSAALRSAIRAEDQTALPDTDKHSLQTDLSFRMSQLLQPDLHQHALPDQQERQASDGLSQQSSFSERQDVLLGSRVSPDTGAVHLTPIGIPLHQASESDLHHVSSVTPARVLGLSPSSIADVTPLCLNLNSLSLLAGDTPAWDQYQSIDTHVGPAQTELMSQPSGLTAESSMSPEILGWHEQHDADNVQRTEGITALLLSGQSAEQTPGSHPASAFKGAQIPATKPMGKATRVQTPAARSRLGKNELKALGTSSPTRPKQDMGSIALLSPVRASNHASQQLGAAKVITPVRRSARKTANTPALASMLRETEFAYAPNEALACPRHPFFDPDTPAEASPAATQQENETASTPSSITGVNLAGALSISAASPLLEQEVSFATYSSSSRLSSQSALRQSPVNCATPPEHIILSLQAEQAPADIVNAPAVASTDAHGMLAEATNTVAASSFMTPPSGVISKNGPQGPVTRSKSARKAVSVATPVTQSYSSQTPSLSPTEAGIREGLRRSARLHKHARHIS